ncbi:hypothetical protein U1E44_06445 [Arenibacter sp. GZD96]|uniref:hypothetical protein n=1 Tax=Aurantibrevibacter litoralis TaxID=3106030 RepID=UPI002AFEEA9D|nr:hypothetical protein [Arenibacter sp. GZD-96]MEA1785722.1 hypothetical protein [Arenibacter sp. GZD-96]
MITTEKTENEAFLKKSIQHLELHGFEQIKADLEGYDRPKTYHKKDSEISITPDIVAYKNGRRYVFDISLKSEKARLLKSKWLVLHALSRLKDHRFKIITTKGHYKFTNDMIKDINLSEESLLKI